VFCQEHRVTRKLGSYFIANADPATEVQKGVLHFEISKLIEERYSWGCDAV
jgi:hypothetical protein